MNLLGKSLLPICGVLGLIFLLVGILNGPHPAYAQHLIAGSILVGSAVVAGAIMNQRSEND